MSETLAAPHKNSYWIPQPARSIVAGEYPGDIDPRHARAKISAILDAGITCFVDLTEHDELNPYEPMLRDEAALRGVTVRHLRRPIRDMRTCAPKDMTVIMQTLRDAIDAGEKVYLHCWGGIGRTGTVVGCWLVEQGMQPEQALSTVTALFRTMSTNKVARHPEGSPQTNAQRAMVRDWPMPAPTERAAPAPATPDGRRDRDHYRGCLLGGAAGDALGAPVEFMSLSEIRQKFGPSGIADFVPAYGKLGAITDDTQMTLFTAEGVIRARAGQVREGSHASNFTFLHNAYLRWLRTQGVRVRAIPGHETPGWLVGVAQLNARRAPGNTCLGALQSGKMGTIDAPINDSKGCGGVMRAAPAGLIGGADPFVLGCESAAVTHGHPSGYLAAGCLALMIERIIAGCSLFDAVSIARERVAQERGHEQVSAALERAVRLAAQGAASAEQVQSLGGGWVAEEALAIAVYCALASPDDFERGVRLAVNHTGDSDSTGAIAGNLLGAALGVSAIPERWLAGVELREVIEQLADDLLIGYGESNEWATKYPAC